MSVDGTVCPCGGWGDGRPQRQRAHNKHVDLPAYLDVNELGGWGGRPSVVLA